MNNGFINDEPMDCFNHLCPFLVNETSNANRCECVINCGSKMDGGED